MSSRPDYPLADLVLARRLERAEGAANVAFVEARAALEPASGAVWISVGGVHAMFDGPSSPLTQTFGLGIFEELDDAGFDDLERFFLDRGAAVMHEVSPYISAATLGALTSRGYRPIEMSTVLVQPTSSRSGNTSPMRIRVIEEHEHEVWSRAAGEGWRSESSELGVFIETFALVLTRAEGVHCFVAESAGRPVATAALTIHGDVAVLAGASTIPEARRMGAQQALLEERLRFAADRGISLAMMVAPPGSSSQRNAERRGFRVAYTRTKWQLPHR